MKYVKLAGLAKKSKPKRGSSVIGSIDDSGEPIPEQRRSPQSGGETAGMAKHRKVPRSAWKAKH